MIKELKEQRKNLDYKIQKKQNSLEQGNSRKEDLEKSRTDVNSARAPYAVTETIKIYLVIVMTVCQNTCIMRMIQLSCHY